MKTRRTLRIVVIVLVMLVASVSALSLIPKPSYPEIKASIRNVDPASVADGAYEGRSFILPVNVRVRVSVSGGKIVGIELLKHFNGQGKPGEAVIAKVLESQSTDVDAVTGATHSSLAILKAIAGALGKGIAR